MSEDKERIVSAQRLSTDEANSPAAVNLRPSTLDEFVGQDKVCQNLKVFIQSAKSRGEVLDHVLLYGPPGLGKTTLSNIISKELGVGFKATSAPMITRSGDLAAILTNLEARDVLFIDEIHRLNPAIEEVLYSAMEDFQLDIIIGEGPSARSVKIDLQPFTLVGATTRSGLVSTPLRERFGIPLRMDFYNHEDLQKIVLRGAHLLNMPISNDGAMEIAKRSRGTPRIAGRLLKRVRDFGAVAGNVEIDSEIADKALRLLDVDAYGLDEFDRRYLTCIAKNYGGGPRGGRCAGAAARRCKPPASRRSTASQRSAPRESSTPCPKGSLRAAKSHTSRCWGTTFPPSSKDAVRSKRPAWASKSGAAKWSCAATSLRSSRSASATIRPAISPRPKRPN